MNWISGIRIALVALVCASTQLQAAEPATVRVGILQFGTVSWELEVMEREGFAEREGIRLEIVPLALKDAANVAIQGEAVDIIVNDWIWVARQRAEGRDFTFVPYSMAVGGLMVRPDLGAHTLADLRGKRLGVAGGPLDKSWLLLQGMASQEHGIDLNAENEIVFGAPPLLAEKARDGELDAVLNYWHYCARLEADGFRRLISAEEAANALGSQGPVSAIGYVFADDWAAGNPAAAFVKASRETKKILQESDEEWQRLADNGDIKDGPAALQVLRDRFREGIPGRSHEEEVRDAGVIYSVLSELGGRKLVGDSTEMAEGTYWRGAPL